MSTPENIGATNVNLIESLETSDPRSLLLDDPALFILHYFPHRIQKLEDFHLRLIDMATKETRSLTLYPAGHGKTTLISTLLPIWALCRNPNIRIAVIAKNEDEAKNKISRYVQAELEGNEELIRDFGPFRPEHDPNKSWSLTNMIIAGRTVRMKEPTLAFFGANSKGVLGHRTDWTICDDVVDVKNSSSAIQREAMRDWFDLSVETGPEFEDSRLTVVGTLFDPEDLYHDLIELRDPETNESLYKVNHEDAIVDEEEHITLWPERWPWRRLMATKAKVGTLNFNKRYRNIAVDKSRMVFKEAYIKGGVEAGERFPGCLDHDYKIGDFDPSWRRVIGFDPAIGVYRGHKFCSLSVLAEGSCKDHEKCYWMIDLIRDQFTLPQQADLILEYHEKYSLDASIIEANSYQVGLKQVVDQKLKDTGMAYRIEPHHTGRHNKVDPEAGVQAMSPYFERGQWHIPWADPHSRRKMKQFVDELIMFPGRTTDTVMSTWVGWFFLQQTAPRYRSYNRLRNPKMTSWGRRTSRRVTKNPYWERDDSSQALGS